MDKLTSQQKRRIIRIGLKLYANFVRTGRESVLVIDENIVNMAGDVFYKQDHTARIEEDLIIGSHGPVPNLEQIESVYQEVSSK